MNALERQTAKRTYKRSLGLYDNRSAICLYAISHEKMRDVKYARNENEYYTHNKYRQIRQMRQIFTRLRDKWQQHYTGNVLEIQSLNRVVSGLYTNCILLNKMCIEFIGCGKGVLNWPCNTKVKPCDTKSCDEFKASALEETCRSELNEGDFRVRTRPSNSVNRGSKTGY